MEQLIQRKKELQNTQNGMKKKINPKVMAAITGLVLVLSAPTRSKKGLT